MKLLIVNADDFGYGRAINRGIVQAHRAGIVTSASLMVNTPATEEAVDLATTLPRLSLGLHVNFTNEAQRLIPFEDPDTTRWEMRRQFDRFVDLTGRLPTHLDAHQHVHRTNECREIFRSLAAEHGLPLRDEAPVTYKGGFYGQWEYGVSDPSKVSFEALSGILSHEIGDGIYELGVHPGYRDPDVHYVYDGDREQELRALTDPRVPVLLAQLDIRLINYHALSEMTEMASPGAECASQG
jgi:predicted glycoside hydrolase/deacetylase ChbG (UPF0249 family)